MCSRLLAVLVASLVLAAGGLWAAEPVVWEGDYVPPPQPVATEVTVGAYIFPGWYRYPGRGDYPYRTHDEDSEWRAVAAKPKPRPLLGFYDDSLPEVNDWHIKWALEHGVSYFAFDWYWNAGEHRLLRTLEQGFLKARYCNLMKFCIHWCNHGLDWRDRPAGITDQDFGPKALTELATYLADHYFRRPNYLRVSGRPVLMVWDSQRLIAANGGPEGFARALRAMNGVLRSRGLRDLYLVSVNETSEAAAAGYSGHTGYGYYGTEVDSEYEWRGGHSIPYETMMTYAANRWRDMTSRPGLPYIVPIPSNWDSRPRSAAGPSITGKTPTKFERICRSSLRYLDKRTNLAVVEAWNEWGEGSFIEPDREWGFGMLDAIRRTFAKAPAAHTDYVPSPTRIAAYSVLQEAELAAARARVQEPYPDQPLLLRTVHWYTDTATPQAPILKGWEFDGDTSEGWQPYQTAPLAVAGGLLTTRPTGDDPQLIVDGVGVKVEQLGCLALRLRVPAGVSGCQLFWTTEADPAMTAGKCLNLRLKGDGQWHTYQVTKQPEGAWSGVLKILRLDVGGPGNRIEVDWVRLYGKAN